MSKDNTIAILITKAEDGTAEFRVKEIQAADNIDYEPTTEDGFNNKAVKNLFGSCKVFNTEFDAWKEAFSLEQKIVEDGSYIEYGIKSFPFPHLFFPN